MSDAMTMEKPKAADTGAGGTICHCTCAPCEDRAVEEGRPVVALCGVVLDDSEALDSLPADNLLCVVCERMGRCPSCGADLTGWLR